MQRRLSCRETKRNYIAILQSSNFICVIGRRKIIRFARPFSFSCFFCLFSSPFYSLFLLLPVLFFLYVFLLLCFSHWTPSLLYSNIFAWATSRRANISARRRYKPEKRRSLIVAERTHKQDWRLQRAEKQARVGKGIKDPPDNEGRIRGGVRGREQARRVNSVEEWRVRLRRGERSGHDREESEGQ